MAQHQKAMTKKQKIIIYSASASMAVIAAVIAVILLVHTVNNPPPAIFNSSGTSYRSVFSELSVSSDIKNTVSDSTTVTTTLLQGINDKATYFTTQYAYFTNEIKTVTINGEECEKSFFINGNADNEYVIEATDNSGNTTTYTVYTKPISAFLEPISHLNENTVTADDFDAINNVKTLVLQLDTSYSPTAESAAIDEILNLCNKFLTRIKTVSESVTSITKAISKYNESPPQLEDENNINKIIVEIDTLLSKDNLTAKQRSTLSLLKEKCNSLISKIYSAMENIE